MAVVIGVAIAGSGLASATPAAAVGDGNPASVAIVMPLTIPISTGSFVDAATLDAATSPGGALFDDLDAVINRGVTLGIDPMVIASIRVLGNTAPPSALQWLDRLRSATNETFELAYADADLTAPLQAGRKSVVAPSSLDFALDPALFTDVPAVDPQYPDATADPDGSEPTLPTTAELFAWDYSIAAVAWPRADSVVERDLRILESSSYDTTILASKNVTRTRGSSAYAKIDDRKVLVADETISSLLSSALSSASDDAWSSSMDAIGSAVSSYSSRAIGTSLILTLDRESAIPAERLAASIDSISALDEATVVGLSAITTTGLHSATLVDQPQSEARVARVKEILVAEGLDRKFAAIAETPKLITGERRLELLVVLSSGAETHAGGWGVATDEFLDDSTALRDTVRLVQSSRNLLTAERGFIYVSVDNDLDQAVTVYVSLQPSLPLVSVEDDRVAVTIEPGAQGKATVPVQSLSNGTVDIAVSLRTASDVRVGQTSHVQVDVRAGWEGPVTIVLAILVVLLFGFGIFRTVVKRRAANRAEAATETMGI
jgi:hypothetical protein